MSGKRILDIIKKAGTALIFFILLVFVKLIATEFGENQADNILSNKEDEEKIDLSLKNEISKREFPIKVDEYTTLITATVKGKAINLYYNIHNIDKDMLPFFDGEEFKKSASLEIQQSLTPAECKLMKQYNYTYKYHYNVINTKHNDLVIIMTKSDCPK